MAESPPAEAPIPTMGKLSAILLVSDCAATIK
jgi:hypothetical protein